MVKEHLQEHIGVIYAWCDVWMISVMNSSCCEKCLFVKNKTDYSHTWLFTVSSWEVLIVEVLQNFLKYLKGLYFKTWK